MHRVPQSPQSICPECSRWLSCHRMFWVGRSIRLKESPVLWTCRFPAPLPSPDRSQTCILVCRLEPLHRATSIWRPLGRRCCPLPHSTYLTNDPGGGSCPIADCPASPSVDCAGVLWSSRGQHHRWYCVLSFTSHQVVERRVSRKHWHDCDHEPIRQSKLNWFASAGMEQNRGSEVLGVETAL